MKSNVILKTIVLSLFLVTIHLTGNAQENKNKIIAKTNFKALQEIADKAERKYAADLEIAKQNKWTLTNFLGIDERGLPRYAISHNIGASATLNTTTTRTDYGVNGAGFVVGIWETGSALESHQDFQSRVTNMDFPSGSSATNHATHVTGTLLGNYTAGGVDLSTGMAPQAEANVYSTSGVISEIPAFIMSTGGLISNHSWGIIGGYKSEGTVNGTKRWTWYGGSSQFNAMGDDPNFGKYNSDCEDLDNIAVNAPYHLIVWATGNSNDDIPVNNDEVRNGTSGTYVNFDASAHPKGDGKQLSCIATHKNAKNIIAVGARAKDIDTLNTSSARGQTDDGRMKPDIIGIGKNLLSAGSSGGYITRSGTSMACPSVAGSALLLQEIYEDFYGSGNFMRSSTLKALIFNSATDHTDLSGLNHIGPDTISGWGTMNTKFAAVQIDDSAWGNGSPGSDVNIVEDSLTTSGLSKTFTINVDANPLSATLCWIDPAGDFSDPIGNSELRNDLNITIKRLSDNTIYYPFVVNGNGTTGTDTKNNAEQIKIDAPTSGLYEVRIFSNSALFDNNNQQFSLVVSGLANTCHYDINLTMDEIPERQYFAVNEIVSTGQVQSNDDVVFDAGQRIKLRPGFKADANNGSTFQTALDGCTP